MYSVKNINKLNIENSKRHTYIKIDADVCKSEWISIKIEI